MTQVATPEDEGANVLTAQSLTWTPHMLHTREGPGVPFKGHKSRMGPQPSSGDSELPTLFTLVETGPS